MSCTTVLLVTGLVITFILLMFCTWFLNKPTTSSCISLFIGKLPFAAIKPWSTISLAGLSAFTDLSRIPITVLKVSVAACFLLRSVAILPKKVASSGVDAEEDVAALLNTSCASFNLPVLISVCTLPTTGAIFCTKDALRFICCNSIAGPKLPLKAAAVARKWCIAVGCKSAAALPKLFSASTCASCLP